MLLRVLGAASLGATLVLGVAASSAQAGGGYYVTGPSYGNAYPGYAYPAYGGYGYTSGYSYGCCRSSFGWHSTSYNPFYPPTPEVYAPPIAPVPAPRVFYSAPVGPCVGQAATDAYGRPIRVVKAGC
jgi:hypothetical protein